MANSASLFQLPEALQSPLTGTNGQREIEEMALDSSKFAPKMEQFTFSHHAGNASVCNGHSVTFMFFRHRF